MEDAYKILIDRPMSYDYLQLCYEAASVYGAYRYILTGKNTFLCIKRVFQAQQHLLAAVPFPANGGMQFNDSTLAWRRDIDDNVLLFCNDPTYEYDDFNEWVKEVRKENESTGL